MIWEMQLEEMGEMGSRGEYKSVEVKEADVTVVVPVALTKAIISFSQLWQRFVKMFAVNGSEHKAKTFSWQEE
jgi:hypothetical protein